MKPIHLVSLSLLSSLASCQLIFDKFVEPCTEVSVSCDDTNILTICSAVDAPKLQVDCGADEVNNLVCNSIQKACTLCGNDTLDPTEECDDGNTADGDDCDSRCLSAAICGDGVVSAGQEQCDDGNQTNADNCDSNCTTPSCGNLIVALDQNGNQESCDDGNQLGGDTCGPTCLSEVCGNGFPDPGEVCDDNNTNSGDGCRGDCASNEPCGDTVVDPPNQQCDDGNAIDNDACTNTCLNARCGDTFVFGQAQGGPEQCDDGNANNNDACLNTCINNLCGDGFPRAGIEQCDDGNGIQTDACLNTCATAICGDGFIRSGTEQCDDQNAIQTDACRNNCQDNICGDGFVRAGVEECDDGNTANNDGCSSVCQDEVCGDGAVQVNLGEECDDGNTANGDSCSLACLSLIQEVEPNGSTANADARATADPAKFNVTGDTRFGAAITAVAERDFFRIQAAFATQVRFETFDQSGVDCAGIHTFIRLFNASGTQLFISGGDGQNLCAALVVNIPQGVSYIEVEDEGNDGLVAPYALEIEFLQNGGNESEGNGSIANADLFPGSDFVVFGNIAAGDQDFYSLNLPQGGSLRIEQFEGPLAGAESCAGATPIDGALTLFNAAGTVLASAGRSGRGSCGMLQGTGSAPQNPGAGNLAPGTYFIQVRADTSGTGLQTFAYSLTISVK